MNNIFSIRFNELRKQRKLSINKIAELFNCSVMKIRRWIDGTHLPEVDYLIELSKLFNVSVSYLIGESDIKSPVNFYKSKEETIAMIEDINKLSAEQRNLIFSMIKNMKNK